jgi:hypothetical protein
LSIIGTQLGEHVSNAEACIIIVSQALMPAYVAYGTECDAANFSGSFGNVVAHRKDLRCLFVKKQMIVPEVWTTNVPVEALGL